MLKILHVADFHIGASFSSFGEKLVEKAQDLHFIAINSMINYANLHEIDAILIAGDTFDNHVVNFNLRLKLFSILSNFNGEIFIVCGNHDYYFKGSFWDHTEIPKNCTLIKTNDWNVIKREKFTLFGASFTNIYEKINISDIKTDNSTINIGLVHADILSDSPYNPLSKNDIKSSNLNYLAVGHNHKFSEILKVSNTFFSAPGNISATGFDEVSQKGFIVATFDENDVSFDFIESKGLEIRNIELDISLLSNTDEAIAIIKKIAQENIFLCLRLIGIDNFNIDVNFIIEHLENNFFTILVENSTEKPENIWRFIEDDTILGEFTRLIRIKYDNGDTSTELLNALKLGIDALTF